MATPLHTRWILPIILIAITASVWVLRRRPTVPYSSAYIGDNTATLWSTTAAVRQQVTTLHYGQRVAVLRRIGDQAEVRADDGSDGWLDAHLLMDPTLWQHSADLLVHARTMPAQALGHTRTLSNLHIEPGRDAARIFQFGRDVRVAVLARKVLAVPESAEDSSDKNAKDTQDKDASAPGTEQTQTKDTQTKDEDWLLVLRTEANAASADSPVKPTSVIPENPGIGPATPIAGWVLAQFIALDPPPPIPDYAGSSGLSVVAWAALDSVPDPGGDKPQYLVAGVHGSEARECDFSALRVYTWGTARQRYETAYVENDICGQLPIHVQKQPAGGTDFSFTELDENNAVRLYRMKQTVVRRVTETGAKPKDR